MSLPHVVMLALFATSVAAGASGQGIDGHAEDAVRGRKVYRRACASCHGRAGRGDGPAASALDPKPRDFTSGKFKFRSTPSGMAPTDEDLYRVVSSGIPRTYMFAWDELLSERERLDVIAYVKTFSDIFEMDDDTAPVAIPAEPSPRRSSVAEGKNLYIVMQCFTCHGRGGRGDGEKAGALQDDWGRDIEAFDFTVGAYKGGSDGVSVFRTFETGLNGTPMPSYADAFVFGGDAVSPSAFRDAYPESDIETLTSYLSAQPTSAELSAMSRDDVASLVAQRKWALVHYVKSLSRDASFMHWLLVEDTEVAR